MGYNKTRDSILPLICDQRRRANRRKAALASAFGQHKIMNEAKNQTHPYCSSRYNGAAVDIGFTSSNSWNAPVACNPIVRMNFPGIQIWHPEITKSKAIF